MPTFTDFRADLHRSRHWARTARAETGDNGGHTVVTQSPIKSLFETDEKNRRAVYKSVGAAAALPDDLVKLYTLHYGAIAAHLPDYRAQIAGVLYVACRKHLTMGITSLFRRYSSQAFRETRNAVEAAGIAPYPSGFENALG